ncbi:MAG TPA: hypothetical protein V6D19_00475 [Stenomitos sp.]
MYASQSQNDWVKQLLFSGMFVAGLAVVLWGVSLALEKYNDDQKSKLITNNLQLVKDNRQLRESNKKLTQQLAEYKQRLDGVKEAMKGY